MKKLLFLFGVIAVVSLGSCKKDNLKAEKPLVKEAYFQFQIVGDGGTQSFQTYRVTNPFAK